MIDRDRMINELRFQLNCKEVKEQYYPIQISASDAEKILALLKEQEAVIRCKDCRQNNQCSIQFKFADADNPGEWFCAYGERRTDDT